MKSLPDISPAPVQPPSKRGGEFALFSKIQGALSHAPNFSKTCKAILDAVMDEMDAENCSLMLKDPTSNQLSVRAARGKKEREATFYSDPTGKGIQFKSGEGIAGWVLEKGQSMLVNNVNQEPRFIKRYACYAHMQSLVCVPIREEDRVVGVFNLSHSKAGAFSEKDKTVLSYVSGQVGAALLSTQFFLNIRPIHPPENGANEIPVEREENPATNSQAPILFDAGEMSPKKRILLDGSERMRRIKELIERVAPTDVTVLVRGESGVGKEVVARFIHENSSRRDKPFIKVNCAAIPQDLLESEFFGYEKGAFTGAYGQKLGKFEVANGGTIFLDEIVEIPHSLQAKLLQVLQDREFPPFDLSREESESRLRLSGNKGLLEIGHLEQTLPHFYW